MNNEQDILRRAQQGDSEAFRLLVEAYQTQVYRLALRLCGEAAADDVTQEAFLAAWRALPEFRGTCRFSTWLYRLTTNAAIDWLRREKRRKHSRPSAVRCPGCQRSTGRSCCCGICRSWTMPRSPRHWRSVRAP